MSQDHFKQALDARDVEEVRRCLKSNRFLVRKPIVVVRRDRTTYPPLVYVVSSHMLSDSVSELVELVRVLLDHKADINAKGQCGLTALRHAVRKNLVEVAELILQYQARVSKWRTALFNLLIAHGAYRYVNTKDINGGTLLCEARSVTVSAAGDTWAFDVIDKLCGKVDEFMYRGILELLIKYGANVKAKHRRSGRTLLHFAAAGYNLTALSRYKDVEFHSEVQLLLEKGSDVDAIDNNGFTPLVYALYYRHPEIVRILVDHGADVSITHENGTPLLACVGKGLVGSASLLLKRGADIHVANQKGSTPFLVACKQGGLDMIYRLIRLSSHHRRLGLLSEVSYPVSSAWSTTVAECDDDVCDGFVSLEHWCYFPSFL